MINCEGQAAVDHYRDRLTSDGGKAAACGWLKDRYGLCWQVIPAEVFEMLADADRDRAARAHSAVMRMVKLDLAEIRRAACGKTIGRGGPCHGQRVRQLGRSVTMTA